MATCAHTDIYAHNHIVKPPELSVKTRKQSAGVISYAWLSLPNTLHLCELLMYGIRQVGNKAAD